MHGLLAGCGAIALLTLNPALADERLKELLGRAQQQLDGKAVEDLIGKLEGGKPRPPEVKPAGTQVPEAKAPAASSANVLTIPGVGQPTGRPAPLSMPSTPPAELSTPASAAAPAAPKSAAPAAAQAPPSSQTAAPAPAATPNAVEPRVVETKPASQPPPSPAKAAEPAPTPPATTAANSKPAAATSTAEQTQLPSVDLEITFEFNSSEISPSALPTLALLGRALSDPRLADATFLIGGHTDSKGRADYNRHLSQIRADAVRAFLISRYGIAPKRLVAKGFGETRLKNPANPQGEENRRVQIVNTSKLAAR